MAAQNNFGIENEPDRFFGTGAYTASDNDLRQKIGLARKTSTSSGSWKKQYHQW